MINMLAMEYTKTSSIENIIIKLVSRINSLINRQVNIIIHTSKFQSLEASWRSLSRLSGEIGISHSSSVKLMVLTINAVELRKDVIDCKGHFYNSNIFKHIYTNEFDLPGGEPYSLIVADFYFYNCSSHIEILNELSLISANSFCPIISGADARLCELNSWGDAKPYHNYEALLKKTEHTKWAKLTTSINCQFIGLMGHRIKVRQLYQQSILAARNYFFNEDGKQHTDYLWGNSAYRYASAIIAAYIETGWFLNTRETITTKTTRHKRNSNARQQFNITESESELLITDAMEDKLNKFGLIVMRENKYNQEEYFYFQPSIYTQINNYQSKPEDTNIRTQIPYLLCACRVAQTLKILLRDKIGKFESPTDCQSWISNWLLSFCSSDQSPQNSTQFKYPLSEAKVYVTDNKQKPGHYACKLYIKPHSLIEGIQSTLMLSTPIELSTNTEEVNNE